MHWGAYFGDADKANTDKTTSPAATTLPGTVEEVATSNSTEYALLSDGTVWAWGQGDRGELGDGGSVNSFTVPMQVSFPAGVVIASLPTDAMPYDTGLALDTTGQAWGWGLNSAGQLCQGATTEEPVPVAIPVQGVTSLAGAGDHALYATASGLYGCGGNHAGDLGNGTTTPAHTPVFISRFTKHTITAVVAAYENSGVLLADGSYFDWGLNAEGQLGNGTESNSSVPVEVVLPKRVQEAVQGGSIGTNGQTLVRLTDGALYTWGDNKCGQLGVATSQPDESAPVLFSPPTGVTFDTLATGGSQSYAITPTGDVYAWGCGGQGQLGDGTAGDSETPVLVESGASLISSTAENVDTAQ
jgi:alpha-tubulin suppressor-like RCC1 family protein